MYHLLGCMYHLDDNTYLRALIETEKEKIRNPVVHNLFTNTTFEEDHTDSDRFTAKGRWRWLKRRVLGRYMFMIFGACSCILL